MHEQSQDFGRVMALCEGNAALVPERRARRAPGPGEVEIRVTACGVCRTDLHIVDRDLAPPRPRLVPGHEAVGRIVALGSGVTGLAVGQRVGVPWLGFTCGECAHCRRGDENLCDRAEFTGYHRDGGYADTMLADARYTFPLPDTYGDVEIAPLLCAGLIGYRALGMAGDAPRLGLYGFGAAAHLMAQVARARGQAVYAFVRPGDDAAMSFARAHGAVWAGGSDDAAPVTLDAAILLAPVGALVPVALRAVRKGGRVVCAGIHMSDIPTFPYALLWGERHLCSVANLTRRDGEEFLAFAARTKLTVATETHPLADANLALARLREGRIAGAAVLLP